MNTSRRGTGRKNVTRESVSQDISQFVYRRSKEEIVEIDDDDDDDLPDLTDQFAFAEEDDVQPIPVKRRKKNLIFENSDDDLDEIEGMDEDERRQMKEAIRQSKLQLEVKDKRRATFATIDKKSISLSEPVKTWAEEETTYSQDETEDYFSVHSSSIKSSVEKLQNERAESPDLFSTPRSSKEEPENIADKSNSPSKSPFKSRTNFSVDDLKSSLDKGIVINLTSVKSHFESNSKNKLKLKKKESSKGQDKKAETTRDSNDQTAGSSAVKLKKRKLCLDDDTEDGGREFVLKDPRKKRKTIFDVKHLKKDNKQKDNTLDPHSVTVKDADDGNDDDDNDDDDDDEDRMQDAGKVQKRNDHTTKMKQSRTTRLERAYSKPKLSIKTLKDAMTARLFFAPPGIDPKTYTYAIMRMMDRTRKRIYRAQKKSFNFIKWGKPIIVGPRETNSLDSRKEKKKSNVGAGSTSAFTSLEEPSIERKRSLRSAQTSTAAPPIKAEPDSVSDRKDPSKFKRDYIESDDSDEDLTKPAFGESASKPKPWKEVLCSKEPETFGENVIISMGYIKQNFVDTSTGTDSLANNRASSLFPCVKDTSKKFETKQKGVDENDVGSVNGKLERGNNILENKQEGAESETKTDGRFPSKFKENLSDQNAEISWTRQDDTTVKDEEKQRTMVSQPVKKEEEFDSSIEAKIKKSKKHAMKALIRELEEKEKEEDSRYQMPMFGIEVRDDIEVGTDDDLLTTTGPHWDSKHGASLPNVATKSRYLKLERTSNKTPRVQRVMSSVARRAADATKKRMKACSLQSLPDISIEIQPSQEDTPSSEERRIVCPICFSKFSKEDIETHAANCDETAPTLNQLSLFTGTPTKSSQPRKSTGSPADSQGSRTDSLGLKNLRVMVMRSPEAHRRFLEQESHSGSKGRRNLNLNKAARSSSGIESRRARRYIDMDKDNNEEIKDSQDEDSQSLTWGFATASQIERKKNKFKVTYGGKKKTQVGDIGRDDVGDVKGASEMTIGSIDTKGGTSEATVKGAWSSLTRNKDVGVASDSDDSDVEMLATYGVKVESKKRKFEEKRSINDILRPQRQKNLRKKKRLGKDFDNNDYENEMALLELSGVTLKRDKVEDRSSFRSRPRKPRKSSSEESEDINDEFENCFICSEKVPKEDFKDHTDTCLEMRGERFVTPGKGEAMRPNISNRSRSKVKESIGTSEQQTVEMDSDEIGDSPVKTFNLIGENSSSCVDFSNQFSFFKKNGQTKRRSRSTGRKGGKYKGKGNYKRGRGKESSNVDNIRFNK